MKRVSIRRTTGVPRSSSTMVYATFLPHDRPLARGRSRTRTNLFDDTIATQAMGYKVVFLVLPPYCGSVLLRASLQFLVVLCV